MVTNRKGLSDNPSNSQHRLEGDSVDDKDATPAKQVLSMAIQGLIARDITIR
jgi:hypothetical protein